MYVCVCLFVFVSVHMYVVLICVSLSQPLDLSLFTPTPLPLHPPPMYLHSSWLLLSGLYLFTTPARLLRPVLHLATRKTELISTLEQVYLDVGVDVAECRENHEKYGTTYTHMELSKHGMLSVVSSFTPFSGEQKGTSTFAP